MRRAGRSDSRSRLVTASRTSTSTVSTSIGVYNVCARTWMPNTSRTAAAQGDGEGEAGDRQEQHVEHPAQAGHRAHRHVDGPLDADELHDEGKAAISRQNTP